MPGPTNPTATTNLQAAAKAAKALVNVALPATVLAYDAATQVATVRVVPCFRRRDPEQGGKVVCYAPPDLPQIPVAFPGGAGFALTWPLAVGSTGLLVVSDRSLDEWKSTGDARTEPQDARRHSLADGVFVPGLRSPADPLTGTQLAADAAVLSGAKVVLQSDDTRLGAASATQAVALGPLVEAQLTALAAAVQAAAAAATGAVVPGDGGTAGAAAFAAALTTALVGFPANTGASKVRAV